MKIIIPMGGKGTRFNSYLPPKPLIEIDGKPMIEHVINYLPKNSEFIFLCDKEHIKNTNISEILKRIAPNCKIVSISNEDFKGPAHACIAAFDYINEDDEIIVNYCDFIQIWDAEEFLIRLREIKPHGAIISFRGFHPSSLGDTYYAYLRVNQDNFIEEVREKQSFSEDRKKDFASTGTYYFSSGSLFKKYTNELISDENNKVNGEYYTTILYNLMIRDNLKVLNHEVNKFLCLGTPRDYEPYKFWSEFYSKISTEHLNFDHIDFNITNIFPIAGGERDFKEIGFDGLNFMLPVMDKHLIEHTIRSNPKAARNIFIGLKEHSDILLKTPFLNKNNSEIFLVDGIKNGPAATVYEVKDRIDPETPVCVAGSTYFLDYNRRKLNNLIEQKDIDIILFSFSHQECVLRDAPSFAYAKLKNNIEVDEVAEKRTISDNPYSDQALTGTIFFRRAGDLFEAIRQEIERKKEKPAFYLTAINNILHKKKAVIFEVDKFIPIRKPLNYREFKYWQNYFNELNYHPYSKN